MGSDRTHTTGDRSVELSAVRRRLDRVDDPELDRSIVDLEYVDRIDVDGGAVTVALVLPTAWCSPTFAWMMATDARDEVAALPGVESVTVRLRDHMHGEDITRGVNAGQSFEETFKDADDGVEAVRRRLDERARFARQYRAVECLLDAGLDPEQIVSLRPTDVDLGVDRAYAAVRVQDWSLSVTVDRAPLADYLEKARETGLVTGPDDRLFADRDGTPVEPGRFEAVHRDARLARSNIEGQATICASLHESRNGVPVDD